MTRWQKIGAVVSVLWLIGLPIWLGMHSGNWKTVGHALIVLHREVVWVLFTQFWIGRPASVVVAVGMWATRLRCPSCPQRCDALTPLMATVPCSFIICIRLTDEVAGEP
jgi:hypothetical protein